ncbi:hypothetical protein HBH56_024890 [Parastagonospora nodorum]|uniref:Uncharacterized protein n=1 Tax=Phaeosphaeria nodorum (strain SN15 / ATCC MYA-4574 / FGSC 10173) TaxID=321614 RepID=A0A7U2I1Y0_PHANO|nr:hypothetical protein HBH56_024890 [Parastagonospora nodorum]QRC98833.1 hypothetical protein JI435_436400 [Parastagonospora nodorum SN15]KAH3934395.1 hypothetical protein HBH54_057110 [Parastagonospora nodorum]KAH3976143.1 hypothetical protein HBH51_080550 [Parastagonospora nodorum]KAH4039302.1 hypothetical protein HBI09_046520 [Parastagonospora nodorum]
MRPHDPLHSLPDMDSDNTRFQAYSTIVQTSQEPLVRPSASKTSENRIFGAQCVRGRPDGLASMLSSIRGGSLSFHLTAPARAGRAIDSDPQARNKVAFVKATPPRSCVAELDG